MTIYTGDILIQQTDDYDFDIVFKNGQPEMTKGFETMAFLVCFGEDWWGNDIVRSETQKMKSTFPNVIRRNTVNDQTVNDGIAALENANKVFITDKICSKIEITGEIFSVYGIYWEIKYYRLDSDDIKFKINWDKGVLTAGFAEEA